MKAIRRIVIVVALLCIAGAAIGYYGSNAFDPAAAAAVRVNAKESGAHVCMQNGEERTFFTALSKANAQEIFDDLPAGRYYLTEDIQIKRTVNVSAQIDLCLNGYCIRGTGSAAALFYILKGGTLNLYDCCTETCTLAEHRHEYKSTVDGQNKTVVGGLLTGGSGETGGCVSLANGRQTSNAFNLYGGTVAGNRTSGNGGAVYVNDSDVFTVYGGTIAENRANGNGGGVFVNTNGRFEMFGGSLSGNEAEQGGGIYLSAGAAPCVLCGGAVANNIAQDNGGGVYVQRGTLEMSGGTIGHNSALINGGGIYLEGEFNLSGGSVLGNSAEEKGGGICLSGRFTISGGASVSSNSASVGGGLYASTGAETSEITFYGGTISSNTAERGGGAYIFNGEYGGVCRVFMRGGAISGNSATAEGGGMYLFVPDFGTLAMSLSGGLLSGNTAASGGGIYAWNCEISLCGGTVEENLAGEGGGVYMGIGKLSVSDGAQISRNTAYGDGGGLYVYHESETCEIVLSGGGISDNRAENGAGIYLYGEYGETCSLLVTGGAVRGNVAAEAGGGIYMRRCAGMLLLSVTGGDLSGNTAQDGGGIYTYGGVFEMSGGTVTGNKAAGAGGGVYMDGERFSLEGSPRIFGNTQGGNVYLASGQNITVTGKLSEDAEIGVKNAFGTFTSGYTESGNSPDAWDGFFFSDDGHPCKSVKAGEVYFSAVHEADRSHLQTDEHDHWAICSVCSAVCEKSAHTFSSWTPMTGSAGNRVHSRRCTDPACGKEISEAMVLRAIEADGMITATAFDGAYSGEIFVTATFAGESGGETETAAVTGAIVEAPWVTTPRSEAFYLVSDAFAVVKYAEGGIEKRTQIGLSVSRKQVEAPTADERTFVYNGREQTYTLRNVQSGWVTVSNNVQKDANERGYTVVAALSDKANCAWAGSADDAEDKTFVFVIGKAPLTVSAEDKQIVYGDFPPVYTLSYDGFLNGESAEILGYTGAAARCSYSRYGDAGDYVIAVSARDTLKNYVVSVVDGTLTVVGRPLKVTVKVPEAAQLVYTGSEKRAEYVVYGLVNGDEITITLLYNGSAEAPVNAGTYRITASVAGEKLGNYQFDDDPCESVLTITNATISFSDPPEYQYLFRSDLPKRALKLSGDDLPKTVDGAEVTLRYAYIGYAECDRNDFIANRLGGLIERVGKEDLGGLDLTEWTVYQTDSAALNISLPSCYCVFFRAEAKNHDTLYGYFWVSLYSERLTFHYRQPQGGDLGSSEYGDAVQTQAELRANVFACVENIGVGAASARYRGKTESIPSLPPEYFRFYLRDKSSGVRYDLGTEESGTCLNAGKYEIFAEYLGASGNGEAYILFDWDGGNPFYTVKPRAIDLTVSFAGHVYGDEPQQEWYTLSAVRSNGAAGSWKGAETDRFELLELRFAFPDSAEAPDCRMPAGSYEVTVQCASGNYAVTVFKRRYEVSKRTLTYRFTPAAGLTYHQVGEFTLALYGVLREDEVRAELRYFGAANDGTVFENSRIAPKTAGDYFVSACLAGGDADNYALTMEAYSYTIHKASLKVAAEDRSAVYGQALPAFALRFSGLFEEDSALMELFSPTCAYRRGEDVGTGSYPITVIAPETLANYSVTLFSGTLTVNKAPLAVAVEPVNTVYGAEYEVGYHVTGAAAGDALTYTVRYGARFEKPVAAGEYTGVTVEVGGAKRANYEVTANSVTINIERKRITVALAGETVYGEEMTPEKIFFSFAADALANGDGEADMIAAIKEAVSSNGGFSYGGYSAGAPVNGEYPLLARDCATANYIVTFLSQNVSVLPRPLSVAVEVENGGTVYGSEPKITARFNGVLAKDKGKVLPVFTYFGASADGLFLHGRENAAAVAPVGAGSYTVLVERVTGESAANYRYIFKEEDAAEPFVIIPKAIVLNLFAPAALTYLNVGKFTVEADGLAEGDKPDWTITYSGRANDGTVYAENNVFAPVLAGKYTIRAALSGTLAANYEYVPQTLEYEIKRAAYDMRAVSFINATVKEDGAAHSLFLSGELPLGVSVVYGGNGKSLPGVYTVTAKFAGDFDNYERIPDMTATLTVLRVRASAGYGGEGEAALPAVVLESEAGLPPAWQLALVRIERAETLFKSGTLKPGERIFAAYGVELFEDGVTVQPDGTFTLRLLIPKQLRGKAFGLLRAQGEGAAEGIEFYVDGNYAVFSADALSVFVFTYQAASVPRIVGFAALLVAAVATAIVCGTVFVSKRKKRR